MWRIFDELAVRRATFRPPRRSPYILPSWKDLANCKKRAAGAALHVFSGAITRLSDSTGASRRAGAATERGSHRSAKAAFDDRLRPSVRSRRPRDRLRSAAPWERSLRPWTGSCWPLERARRVRAEVSPSSTSTMCASPSRPPTSLAQRNSYAVIPEQTAGGNRTSFTPQSHERQKLSRPRELQLSSAAMRDLGRLTYSL